VERLTKLLGKGKYIVDNIMVSPGDEGCFGVAIEKLAKFENLYEYLTDRQRTIPKEMEKLRNENRTKSYKFRELLGEKLMNETLLSLFRRHGIE
jgi:hypothetical protein